MSVLKQQVNFSSNFTLFFIIMTHNSYVNFMVIPFLLWTKKRIPSKSQFWYFQVLWWKFSKFFMSFFKPQVSFSSNFAPLFSFMKNNSSALFLAQTLYTFVTKRLLKHNFFRLLIAWVKILQIPHVRFKTKSQFLFECSCQNLSNSSCKFWNEKSIPLQILYPSLVPWKITPLYFFDSSNIYFAQKERINMNIFGTFKCLA